MLILHHVQEDTVSIYNPDLLANILYELTQNKLVYFFLRDKGKENDKIIISGYALWRDKKRLWHHVAKIQDTYTFENKKFLLQKVKIDLYPFVRMENVMTLFVEKKKSNHGIKK